jgi:short-subunit dehydrogenase
MVTFTVTLRHELAGTGVRAVVCCPGIVESEFHGSNYQGPPGMAAEDVTTACIKALAEDEAICAPGLEDVAAIDTLHAAQRDLLMGGGRATKLASRYQS